MTAQRDEPEGHGEARTTYYGLTEIASALDLDRQLVTAWRRRGSHAIPEPDAELSSGPIWRDVTIEPWIRAMRARTNSSGEVADLSPEAALRLGRRVLRCSALVLEIPPRGHLLARAVADVRALLPDLAARVGPLADRARAVTADLEEHLSGKATPALAGALVSALPAVADLVATARLRTGKGG